MKQTKPQPKPITAQDLEKARKALASIKPGEKRVNPTTRLLTDLAPDIDKARLAGVSWTVIADQINAALGTKIHPATIRAHHSKAEKKPEFALASA